MPTKSKVVVNEAALIGSVLAALTPEAREEYERVMWEKIDVGVDYFGNKITLPDDPHKMSISDAINALQRKRNEEEEMLAVFERIEGYPFDAAVAFVKAMRLKFGWATPVPTMTWFGPKPPQLLTVKTGPYRDETVQVPTGEFSLPGVENTIFAHFHGTGSEVSFVVHGQVRKREATILMELAVLTREILAKESIYKGKALRIRVGDDGSLDRGMEPEFMYTDHVDVNNLILPRDVERLMDINLFTPIRNLEACRKHKVPLKRGILLEGQYGIGKTLTGSITSRICVENGWTFISLDKVSGLRAALEFAQQYQPAVIFAEDIDRVSEKRDDKTNDLLNTIDGVLSKRAEVIVVLTTNHVEKINKAMLRPGRLDAIISLLPPDAEAVRRLLWLYSGANLDMDEDIDRVCETLAGEIPATIREVVERAKLAMIMRGGSQVAVTDLTVIALSMKRHLELLNGPVLTELSPAHKLGEAFAELIGSGGGLDKLNKHVATLVDAAIQGLVNDSTIRNAVNELTYNASAAVKNNGSKIAAIKKDTSEIKEHLEVQE